MDAFVCAASEPEVRLRVSYHEAGHAIAAIALGVPVRCASVYPLGEERGRVVFAQTFKDVDLEVHLLLTLAGPTAELRHAPTASWSELLAGGDMYDVETIFGYERLVEKWTPDRVSAEIGEFRAKADRLVERYWPWIGRTAEQLAERRYLTGVEIEALRRGAGHL
jgi:hypothetical protein